MEGRSSKLLIAAVVSLAVAISPAFGFQKPKTNPGKSGDAPGQTQDKGNNGGNNSGNSNAGGNGSANGNAATGNAGGNGPGAGQSSQTNGNSAPAKLKVTWDLPASEVAAALHTAGSVTIPFHVSARVEAAGFWLTPSLQEYLQILTEPFDVLDPGVTYEVKLAWKGTPAETTIGGTLHLVPVTEDDDELRRTYPQPLVINVKKPGAPAEEEGDEDIAPADQQLTIVSSVTWEGPPIAPLQIVSIFGMGIGPAEFTPAIVEDGKVTSYLADVQVLFDGTAAPIIFASSSELKVVVPSNVAGKETVDLTVTYKGKMWEILDIPVVETSPEIMSMNGLGHGLAIAYDSEGKVISEENPVAPGEIITFFGTGVGLWKDGFIDGTIVDPASLPEPKKPVEVKIGGAVAKLLFVGGAPGLVSAIVQFNVVVPEEMPEVDDSTNPPSAAIKVTSGGHASKSDIFIYIGGA